jgi:hypothetical protein
MQAYLQLNPLAAGFEGIAEPLGRRALGMGALGKEKGADVTIGAFGEGMGS